MCFFISLSIFLYSMIWIWIFFRFAFPLPIMFQTKNGKNSIQFIFATQFNNFDVFHPFFPNWSQCWIDANWIRIANYPQLSISIWVLNAHQTLLSILQCGSLNEIYTRLLIRESEIISTEINWNYIIKSLTDLIVSLKIKYNVISQTIVHYVRVTVLMKLDRMKNDWNFRIVR